MSMMLDRAIQVLLVLQGLQSWATQCDDQVAYVQKDLKALKADALEALVFEVTGRTCSFGDINAGDCNGAFGAGKCLQCDPMGGQVVPTPGMGFSGGLLRCGVQSCLMASGTNASDFYEFRNSRDYLECAFEGCRPFNARNMAAVCCFGFSSCQHGDFRLHGDHSCGGDVCCSGGGGGGATCLGSKFSAVRHMACVESDACRQVSVNMTGDLVVGGSGAATGAEFTFTTGGPHCISIRGRGVFVPQVNRNPMNSANFTFEQRSRVRMLCDSGTDPCQDVAVFMASGSCFQVACEAPGACDGMRVWPLVAGGSITCHCSGNGCGWTNAHDYCSPSDENPCGTDVCPGTQAACDTGGGNEDLDCDAFANAPPCGGDVTGDPHIRTLDGRHYTLLQQGNFLLWAFSGYETEVLVNGASKKVPVDFEILTHYAGHTSFTKGLLLVDQSQKPSQALEMTASDCLWHHWDASTWRPVESGLLNITDPEGVHFGTFKLAKSKGQNKLELLINEGAAPRTLAQLWISCRPGHQLSTKIKMSSQRDLRFVRGELAPGRLSLAAGLQSRGTEMATDAEFAVTSDWAALGGSSAAASYFKMFDTKGSDLAARECTNEDKDEYANTCRKHLGDSRDALYKEVLDDCIFDLCNGGGETSAELAAEIYHAE